MAKNRRVIKVYNKVTKKWEDKVVSGKEQENKTPKDKTATTKPSKTGSTMTTPSTDPKSAAGKAAKKKNKTEYYTLSGTLKLLPNKNTIKIRPNHVLRLNNLGTYLSGKYYVASVTRTIDSNGYSQELGLFKPNFRQQFKEKKTTTKSKTKKKKKTPSSVRGRLLSSRSAPNESVNLEATSEEIDSRNLRIHVLSSPSETLWTLANRYYGDSSKWKDIYLLSTGERPDPLNLKIGMKLVIP